ncbi:MAG: hypothetical protein DRJ64_09840 [Thermoprotei archaeon]|nr:MAG: hypothetical protein DRJ64_09840 [Thermoprotei archaeon]
MGLRGVKEKCILVHSDPHFWEVRELTKLGDLLVDKMTGKIYAGNGRKVAVRKGNNKFVFYRLVDAEKGIPFEIEKLKKVKEVKIMDEDKGEVRLEKDETILKLKPLGEIAYHAIDGGLLLKLFKIRPTLGQIIAGVIIGLVIGVIVGGVLF